MDKNTAAIALQFLQRVQLSSPEIPAFLAVDTALRAIASGAAVVMPSKEEPPP